MIERLSLNEADRVVDRYNSQPSTAVLVPSPPRLDDDVTLAAQMLAAARSSGLDEPTDLGDWAIDALDAERLLDRVPRPMSRGERQLCGLLIAFAAPFDALYIVDPTAGLDARRRRAVADILADLAVDHTVVCASDDPDIVQASSASS